MIDFSWMLLSCKFANSRVSLCSPLLYICQLHQCQTTSLERRGVFAPLQSDRLSMLLSCFNMCLLLVFVVFYCVRSYLARDLCCLEKSGDLKEILKCSWCELEKTGDVIIVHHQFDTPTVVFCLCSLIHFGVRSVGRCY